MALFEVATKDSGKAPSKAPLLEAGGYPARLVRLVDLGKHPGSQKFPDPQYKMSATFELLDEYMKETNEDGSFVMVQDPDEDEGVMMAKDLLDKPRWFDFDFTYNADGFMGEKSHIYKFMTAVDAFEVKPNPTAVPPVEGHPALPLSELLGAPLTITLSSYTKQEGKNAGQQANKIVSFAPMKSKEKKTARELINPTVFFNLGAPDMEVFSKLPGGDSPYAIKNRILANLEFNGSELQRLLGITPDAAAAAGPVANTASDEQVDAALAAEMEAQRAAKEAAAANATPEAGGAIPF